MNQLTKKNTILVGLTLFSMFFGAGNLIFPPFLGNQAGVNVWIAMAGFAVTAIGFPIFGVAAVAKSGGLDVLARRVHPVFASIFTLLIYVSIGPDLQFRERQALLLRWQCCLLFRRVSMPGKYS